MQSTAQTTQHCLSYGNELFAESGRAPDQRSEALTTLECRARHKNGTSDTLSTKNGIYTIIFQISL